MCELTLLNNSMYQWRNYYGLGPGEHGGPQPQWAKWWPPGWGCTEKNIGQGLWYVKMSFSDHQNSVKSLQSPGNGISETLDSKILRVSIPWTLLKKLVYIRRSTRAFDTSIRGAFEHFEPGAPWYNVTPLVCTPVKLACFNSCCYHLHIIRVESWFEYFVPGDKGREYIFHHKRGKVPNQLEDGMYFKGPFIIP
jgi:hypothetical protein